MRWQVLAGIGLTVAVVTVPIVYSVQRQVQYRNFRVVEDGKLYRGGQMPVSALERLHREHGIRTVVSIREPFSKGDEADLEEEAFCKANGIVLKRVPPAEWSAPDGTVPAHGGIEEFLRWMSDPAVQKPVLVHCFAGLHRTGAHVAAYRMRHNGWSADEAITEMMSIQPRRAGFKPDMLDYLRSFPNRSK